MKKRSRCRKQFNSGMNLFLAKRQKNRCARCGLKLMPNDELHQDHYVPLSKGGTNDLTNIRLDHASCNLSKGSKLP